MTYNPIEAAIIRAEDDSNQGASYTLLIETVDGKARANIGVSANWQPTSSGKDVLTGWHLVGDGEDHDLFINPNNVVAVTIQW